MLYSSLDDPVCSFIFMVVNKVDLLICKILAGEGGQRLFGHKVMISPKVNCIIAIYRVSFVIGDSLKS